MVTLNEFVKRFTNLKKYVIKRTKQILKEYETEIVDMIRSQQLAGIDSEGNQMQSGYSKGYKKRRQKAGLQTKFVDLHFTGKMHKGMKVRAVPNGVDIRSREPYEYWVRYHFPKGFSLTVKNAEIVGNFVADKLAVDIENFLVK